VMAGSGLPDNLPRRPRTGRASPSAAVDLSRLDRPSLTSHLEYRMTQILARRRAIRAALFLPMVSGPLLAQSSGTTAPSTPTEVVVQCLNAAATAFVQCLTDLPWYAEGLCYSKYAADGILCAPSTLLKFMMA